MYKFLCLLGQWGVFTKIYPFKIWKTPFLKFYPNFFKIITWVSRRSLFEKYNHIRIKTKNLFANAIAKKTNNVPKGLELSSSGFSLPTQKKQLSTPLYKNYWNLLKLEEARSSNSLFYFEEVNLGFYNALVLIICTVSTEKSGTAIQNSTIKED